MLITTNGQQETFSSRFAFAYQQPSLERRLSREMCRNEAKLVQITRERVRQNVLARQRYISAGFLVSEKPSTDPPVPPNAIKRYVSRCRVDPRRCMLTAYRPVLQDLPVVASRRESRSVGMHDRGRLQKTVNIEKYVYIPTYMYTALANVLPVSFQKDPATF